MEYCSCRWSGGSQLKHASAMRRYYPGQVHVRVSAPVTDVHTALDQPRGTHVSQNTRYGASIQENPMPENHVEAMVTGVRYLHMAEDAETVSDRVAFTNLGHAWREVARELRLGKAKTNTYRDVDVTKPRKVAHVGKDEDDQSVDEFAQDNLVSPR